MTDNKTDDMIDRWQNAITQDEECRQAVNLSSCELANATNDLGKWLTPANAVIGEKFHIWYYGGLLEVSLTKNGDHTVKIREVVVRE